MGFNFPDAPTIGQVFSPFEWDGEKWFLQIKPGMGNALVSVGDTPPVDPVAGQFWWNSTSGVLFFRFDDGTSSQWVVATPTPDASMMVSKTYVDAADAALLTHVDDADAAALVHVDAADAALKVYVDAADAAAKAYTDTGDANAKSYTDAGDAALYGIIGNVVRYTPQTLTAPQQAQARSNINAASSTWQKQYIINGAMMISQENGAGVGSVAGFYPADQWWAEVGGGGAWTIAQVASPTPGGSPNRIRLTVSTPAALAANDYGAIVQFVEGSRCFDLRFGTTSPKALTLRWGCRAPAGTYSMVVLNGAMTRSFVSEFTILPGEANTDVVRTITVPGDQAGTWAGDNTRCLYLRWSVRAGTNYQQAPGTWGTGNALGSPNQFNLFGTINNTFELFDVAAYEGNAAPNYVTTEPLFEFLRCCRYFQFNRYAEGGDALGTGSFYIIHNPLVPYRITPLLSLVSTTLYVECSPWAAGINVTNATINASHMRADAGDYNIGGTCTPPLPAQAGTYSVGMYNNSVKFNARM